MLVSERWGALDGRRSQRVGARARARPPARRQGARLTSSSGTSAVFSPSFTTSSGAFSVRSSPPKDTDFAMVSSACIIDRASWVRSMSPS
jgi:hypothetical protein